MALTADDLILRTLDPDNKDTATSFATLPELEGIVKFRMDYGVWSAQTDEMKVRAAVSAYKDLNKLTWITRSGYSQSRDYEYLEMVGVLNATYNYPPLQLPEFTTAIKEAQAAQAMYILNGTQVRDMAREGVRMTRALQGSEVEITGYRGPVCAEAVEVIARWIEIFPVYRRL